MRENGRGYFPSRLVKVVGVVQRRKRWLIVPFLLSTAFAVALNLFLTQFYESPIFPSVVKQWLESENIRSTRGALENLRETLRSQDAEIIQFKQMHKNELASRLKMNLQVLGQLHIDLFETKRAIKTKHGSEESRIKTDPLWAGLQKKTRLLEEMRKRYSDGHRKIVELKKEIREFEKMIAAKSEGPESLIQLEKSLASLTEREKQLSQSVLAYERRIERTIEREVALSDLVRRRHDTFAAYESLLNKKTAYIPDSLMIILGGIGLGLLMGIVLMVFREKMDRTIRTESELDHLLSLPIILSVFDYGKVPEEKVVRPSAMRSAASSGSALYGPKTLFLVKDRR